MSHQILLWVGFNILVLILLAVDLGVFHRGARTIKIKEALCWSAIWIVVALLFNVVIYFWRGGETALQFLTGYLIERSLSVDNLFVFLMIFSYFRVASQYQYKVLFWGILGALIMRAIFIATGVALINTFHWIIYVFGAFLIIIAVKMAFEKEKEIHPEKNPVLLLFRKLMPVTENYVEGKFFIRKNRKSLATPLFVVLLVIETTDVVFALDSIPAILAITTDPFIVYTSNVFAILGLRALYFALAGVMELFHYLNIGLSVILAFVGAKMLLSKFYEIPVTVALGVVALTLIVSIIASLMFPQADKTRSKPAGTAADK
ncbi:MAG: TerC family protein [Proteobacteria bacterium]|nr:TerC family protein [Pseudomonadota bacterium]